MIYLQLVYCDDIVLPNPPRIQHPSKAFTIGEEYIYLCSYPASFQFVSIVKWGHFKSLAINKEAHNVRVTENLGPHDMHITLK